MTRFYRPASLLCRWLPLLLPAVLATVPGSAATNRGHLAGILAVSARNGELRATVTFTNHSARGVWLEQVEDGQGAARSEFEIRSDGRQVPYIGPPARPLPGDRGAFFALEPGQSHVRELRLDDLYQFPEGSKDYTATFSYLVWDEKTRRAAVRTLRPVRFNYSR
jgi:hypothetical protein